MVVMTADIALNNCLLHVELEQSVDAYTEVAWKRSIAARIGPARSGLREALHETDDSTEEIDAQWLLDAEVRCGGQITRKENRQTEPDEVLRVACSGSAAWWSLFGIEGAHSEGESNIEVAGTRLHPPIPQSTRNRGG